MEDNKECNTTFLPEDIIKASAEYFERRQRLKTLEQETVNAAMTEIKTLQKNAEDNDSIRDIEEIYDLARIIAVEAQNTDFISECGQFGEKKSYNDEKCRQIVHAVRLYLQDERMLEQLYQYYLHGKTERENTGDTGTTTISAQSDSNWLIKLDTYILRMITQNAPGAQRNNKESENEYQNTEG